MQVRFGRKTQGVSVGSTIEIMTENFANTIDETMGQRIFFSVGEPSGDLHAASLIQCMRAMDPSTRVRGFGGSKMIQAGLDLDFDLTSMAVVGISEVIPKLREFFRIADIAEGCFRRGEVDGVVLVDFPGFNWHIAKRAKKYGLPCLLLPTSAALGLGWMARQENEALCRSGFLQFAIREGVVRCPRGQYDVRRSPFFRFDCKCLDGFEVHRAVAGLGTIASRCITWFAGA